VVVPDRWVIIGRRVVRRRVALRWIVRWIVGRRRRGWLLSRAPSRAARERQPTMSCRRKCLHHRHSTSNRKPPAFRPGIFPAARGRLSVQGVSASRIPTKSNPAAAATRPSKCFGAPFSPSQSPRESRYDSPKVQRGIAIHRSTP